MPPESHPLARGIPSTGERLPVVGLGTWQSFDVGRSPAERAPLAAVLRAFAAAGGRLVDSSPMYGRSEEVVGQLAAESGLGAALFMATKVWTSGRVAGQRQIEASMRKLRVPRLDLLQVHNLLDVDAHLDTLRALKDAGRVRYIGITHYAASAHEAVARCLERYVLDFVQINYSVAEPEASQRLLPLAADRGVAVIANRPFASGALLSRLQARPLPAWAAELEVVSWAQLLLKFVIAHPAVTCAIPATSRVEHVRENLATARGPLPDDKQRARIPLACA